MCCIPAVAIPLLIVSIVISALFSKPQISKPYTMDIPINIPRQINPEIQDPISKSVVYSFTTKDSHINNTGYIMYQFPYSKNTYWTNFKYSCYNDITGQPIPLEIGLELETSDGYTYCVQMLHERQDKVWYNTEWPFPSVKTVGQKAGLYFKIKPPSNEVKYTIYISLLGFMDLFPNVENYLLLSTLDTYQLVFSKFEYDDPDLSTGSIYNVEHYDYISDIVKKECGIRLIKRY
jgi:hypothetical protein